MLSKLSGRGQESPCLALMALNMRRRPATIRPEAAACIWGVRWHRSAVAGLGILLLASWACPVGRCTMRFGSTAQVLAKRKLKYYRISE